MDECLIELPKAEFTHAASLFAGLEHHLAVPAVFAGAAEGEVWVDDRTQPKVGVLKVSHRFYLGGVPLEGDCLGGMEALFAEKIIPATRVAHQWGFLLYFTPGFQALIPTATLPGGVERYPGDRQYYLRDISPLDPMTTPVLPEGFQLVEVSAELLADCDLGAREELIAEMQSERASAEEFLEKSFGMCLLHEHRVAGWCLSEYNLGARCEVGIATAEPFRRRGLAVMQGNAFLRLAAARGITQVGWHCWKNNVGSAITAQRLNFRAVQDYPSFFVQV